MKNSAAFQSSHSLQRFPFWKTKKQKKIENKRHRNYSKCDTKLYISDKGMNKSLRHQRLLYIKYKQCVKMREGQ